ncbi:MAG: aspartate aminotransferase family protein, partial [Comamonadaceae bacterium]
AVLTDLIERATPGLHATVGPRFFGWVIGGSHPVGVAADWLTSAWGQNAGNHTASPAAAAAEAVAANWLLDLLQLPPTASVGFVTGATVANFVCLAAARSEVLRRAGWDFEAKGAFGAPRPTVLIGEDAHSTVFAALQYLGFGSNDLVRIATDDQGAIDRQTFAETIAKTAGPTIVVTQAGQINTGAFDPHEFILEATREHSNCWVHVDGAFGLWARACPARAEQAAGIERADSWATDGHKWLQTPYDCGYAIVKDPEAHRRAMTIEASYLPPVTAGERDPSHFVPELSRRARGFATWAMLRYLGREGVSTMVFRHCQLAQLFARTLETEDGVTVVNDVVLNQVVVRFGDSDDETRAVIEAVQSAGVMFAGGARWQRQWVMRLSIINCETTEDDVARSAGSILDSWRSVHRSLAVGKAP